MVIREDGFCCMGHDSGLNLRWLCHLEPSAFARRAMCEHLAKRRAPHTQEFLDLPDLADEEPVHLLRQNRQNKTIMLVARARQRPQIGPRTEMHAVGQRQG